MIDAALKPKILIIIEFWVPSAVALEGLMKRANPTCLIRSVGQRFLNLALMDALGGLLPRNGMNLVQRSYLLQWLPKHTVEWT